MSAPMPMRVGLGSGVLFCEVVAILRPRRRERHLPMMPSGRGGRQKDDFDGDDKDLDVLLSMVSEESSWS